MHKVLILMSTYNGEAYIKEQIDSILKQRDVHVRLLVRDDGSRDRTLTILEAYHQEGKLDWYQGGNLRSAYSFWDLIEKAPCCDYYAFADQDDVWYEDKMITAIEKLIQHQALPALYFCRKRLVNQDLISIDCEDELVTHLGLGTNLLHCHAAGCTMVFNQALMKLLKQYKPDVMSMHDSWILRVASACGVVVYDPTVHMDYRQHSNNVVGANGSSFAIFKTRLHTLTSRRQDHARTTMARQLYEHYGDRIRNNEDKAMLYAFSRIRSSKKARWSLIRSGYLKPHNKKETMFVNLIVFLGWI